MQYLLGAIDSIFADAGVLRQTPVTSVSKGRSLKPSATETPQAGTSISGPVREVKEILPNMDIGLIEVCLALCLSAPFSSYFPTFGTELHY